MLNMTDIMETITMIQEENLDIRTITMGFPCWTAAMMTSTVLRKGAR
jgi:uncharacterized protein (UPF0210 family)